MENVISARQSVIDLRLSAFVDEDELDDHQVIVKGDETAKEGECDQPEQTMAWTGA